MKQETIFQKVYDGEGTHDLARDSFEAFHPQFNPKIKDIPKDKNGHLSGRFIVTIKWEAENVLHKNNG